MKVLVIGTFLPKDFEEKIKNLSAAGNQFQYNMFNTIKKMHEAKALCYVAVPRAKVSSSELHQINAEGIEAFFPKENGLMEIFRFRKRLTELLKWADRVICYNMVYAWFGVADMARSRNVKSTLVLADHSPWAEAGNFIRRIIARISEKNFNKFDKVVTLSQGAANYITDKNKVTVINGCLDWDLFKDIPLPIKTDTFNIAYTGVIGRVTGVDLLLEAFMKIKSEKARLIICGQGNELDEEIKKATQEDGRISYMGYISKANYIQVLTNASMLVNPRNMNFLQNKNNFPSKVLEYIASGRMVLSTKFNGYENYKKLVRFAESEADSLSREIERCMLMDSQSYADTYRENREFARNINWERQIKDFIE